MMKKMSALQELTSYVTSARSKGFSDEVIRQNLLKAGWQEDSIQQVLTPNQSHQSVVHQSVSPIKIIIFIILFLLIGGGAAYGFYRYQAQQITTPSPTPSPIALPPANPSAHPSSGLSSAVPFAHNGFGFDVFKDLLKTEGDKNVVISPTSIALALSMTYNGASGSTKLAMANTLKIADIDITKLNEGSAALIKFLTNPDPQVTLSIANSIWARKDVTFLQPFLNTNTTYYNAQIQSLDFSLPSAADTINAWVSTNTKGKIPAIIGKPIDPSIVMYLINAIYFYGTWTNEFDASLTQAKTFTLPDNSTIQHSLMKQHREDFLYQETDAFQAVQLPYGKDKRLSMVIVLPKTTVTALLEKMTQTTWDSWMKSFAEMEGTVLLPKFKIEYKTSLKNSLSTLGMGDAFSGSADFSGMRTQRDLFISDVIHKTYIDVNEKGTEAAAATAVGIGLTAVMPTKKTFIMEVNKPFFFAITDNGSGEILFMGLINNPSQ